MLFVGIVLLLIGIGVVYYFYSPEQTTTVESPSKTLSGMTIPLVGTEDHIREMKALLGDMERMIAQQRKDDVAHISLLLHDLIVSMSGYQLPEITKEQLRYIDQQNTYLREALLQGDWKKVELTFQKVRLIHRLS